MSAHVRVSEFLLDRSANGYTRATLEWHEHSLDKFIEWVENTHSDDPSSWTANTLRQYIVHLRNSLSRNGTPLSDASVTSYTSSMLAFVKWLYEEDYIEKDITKNVRKPRLPLQQKHAFTRKEVDALLRASLQSAQGLRDYAIMAVMLDCGLRASEVCNLTLGDVRLDAGFLIVRQGKGRKDRDVPFDEVTRKAIRRYIQKGRRSHDVEGDVLFVSYRGGKLRPNSLLQLVKRIANAAGVQDAHPHRFRHTFALTFLRNGGDALTLRRLLGHTSLTVTQGYVNMLTDDLKRVHEKASPMKSFRG